MNTLPSTDEIDQLDTLLGEVEDPIDDVDETQEDNMEEGIEYNYLGMNILSNQEINEFENQDFKPQFINNNPLDDFKFNIPLINNSDKEQLPSYSIMKSEIEGFLSKRSTYKSALELSLLMVDLYKETSEPIYLLCFTLYQMVCIKEAFNILDNLTDLTLKMKILYSEIGLELKFYDKVEAHLYPLKEYKHYEVQYLLGKLYHLTNRPKLAEKYYLNAYLLKPTNIQIVDALCEVKCMKLEDLINWIKKPFGNINIEDDILSQEAKEENNLNEEIENPSTKVNKSNNEDSSCTQLNNKKEDNLTLKRKDTNIDERGSKRINLTHKNTCPKFNNLIQNIHLIKVYITYNKSKEANQQLNFISKTLNNNSLILNLKGKIFILDQKYYKAINVFKQLLNNQCCYYDLEPYAIVLFKLKEKKLCLHAIEYIHDVIPHSNIANLFLICSSLLNDQESEVLSLLKNNDYGGSIYIKCLLGLYYYDKEQYFKAETHFDQILIYQSNHLEALKHLISIYTKEIKYYDKIETSLLKAIELYPQDNELNKLAFMYYYNKNLNQDIKDYNKLFNYLQQCINNQYYDKIILLYYSIFLASKGLYNKSKEVLIKLKDSYPAHYGISLAWAKVLFCLNQFDDAHLEFHLVNNMFLKEDNIVPKIQKPRVSLMLKSFINSCLNEKSHLSKEELTKCFLDDFYGFEI